MKPCDDIRERLTPYLDGDLDPDRGTVVRGHLRTCEACRQLASDEAALRDGLRSLPPLDPPASLWANVQARLAAAEVEAAKQPAWRRAIARWRPLLPRIGFGLAVAAAAAVLVVWKVNLSGERTASPIAEAGSADPVAPRIADHPSPEIAASSKEGPTPPSVPSADDATADLLAEPARVTASYEATAKELLALATEARPGWTDAAKAAFDEKVAGFQGELAKAADERARQKTYRAMIRYVQNAVVRDEVMLARAP